MYYHVRRKAQTTNAYMQEPPCDSNTVLPFLMHSVD